MATDTSSSLGRETDLFANSELCGEATDNLEAAMRLQEIGGRDVVRQSDEIQYLPCPRSVPRETTISDLRRYSVPDGGDVKDSEKSQSNVATPGGWKRRNRTKKGPDARFKPSKISSFELCILNADGKTGAEMFAPAVGMTFDSCQEAYDQYNLFSWENGFGIRHGKTRNGVGGYLQMQEYVCQCQGKPEDNSASCRTDCKARLRLLRLADHGWYVSIFENTHNHPQSQGREERMQWNSHSTIDPMLTGFIHTLRENNVSLGKVYNILNATHGEKTGAPFRKQNLRYICSCLAQESIKEDMAKTRKVLDEMKIVDPYLSVKIDRDEEGSIKAILWSIGKNQEDYMYFGDVVTFDTTYRTNLYNMPFGIFVGVNNHFQSTIFGGVLMREETTVGFEWAFRTFVETMNGKEPATMLTDQCRVMEAAIKSTLPNTRHRWCKWHVLKCAKENLGPIYSKNNTFKKFHSIINDILCVEEFEEKWSELMVKHKLTQNKYLTSLYSNRAKWAKPYFAEIFCAGMTSTQRSESANHLLKQYIPRSSTMHLFVKQYNRLLRSRSTDEGREQHITNMKKRKYNIGSPIEVHAGQIYTNAVYQKFEAEMYASNALVAHCISENQFEVKQAVPDYMVEYHARPYKVTVHANGDFIECDCGYFGHIGMMCRHVLKIMIRNDILKIPTKNIVKRWTKEAKEGCSGDMLMPSNATEADEITARQNILYIAAMEVVKEVALCKGMMGKSLKLFREIKMEAYSMRTKEKGTEYMEEAGDSDVHSLEGNKVAELKAPKRVKPQGRPATKRIRSRMEYVKMFKQKNKLVATLYGDEH